jgi:hypothetical protein
MCCLQQSNIHRRRGDSPRSKSNPPASGQLAVIHNPPGLQPPHTKHLLQSLAQADLAPTLDTAEAESADSSSTTTITLHEQSMVGQEDVARGKPHIPSRTYKVHFRLRLPPPGALLH